MAIARQLKSALRWLLSWPGRFELPSLLLIATIAGGLWGFVLLASEVLEGDTHSFDQKVLLLMRVPGEPDNPVGPRWLEEAVRDYTALGGVSVLTLLTIAVLLFLWMQRKSHAAVLVLAAVVTGMILSTALKRGFDRPRPDLVAHGSTVYTASFPSGHSMMSAVTYLTLGALVARVQSRRRLKIFSLTTAILLTVLVGASRVYLGVHWPTDVFAGWTAGAVWASLCWLVAMQLQRKGQVETDQNDDALPSESST